MKKKVTKQEEEKVPQFPKYLFKVNGKRVFYNFSEAVALLDSGFQNVEFGRYVLNADFSANLMTEVDQAKLLEAADKYGSSK